MKRTLSSLFDASYATGRSGPNASRRVVGSIARVPKPFATPDPATNGSAEAALRVLLYSHDSWGLGHLRRCLAIAAALVDSDPHATVLIVSGSPCVSQFELPERCDVVKLPSIGKDETGAYVTRRLQLSLEGALALRSNLIMAAYASFDPHVIIVDHQLLGLNGEAMPMVKAAREAGKLTIYGMRDIVDCAAAVEQGWRSEAARRALAEDYDLICVYGDDRVFDAVREYPLLRPLAHKIRQVGYIANAIRPADRIPVPTLRRQVLVMVGGGEDGEQLIEVYLRVLGLAEFDWQSRIVAGPLMPRAKVAAYRSRVARLSYSASVRISRFHPNVPRLLQECDVVISMAGYNSCTEILQSGKPAILLPRRHMRQEQAIRAERLARHGMARWLEKLEPGELRGMIEASLGLEVAPHDGIAGQETAFRPNLGGLTELCALIKRMVGPQAPVAGKPALQRL